jgi:hypothetical protein
VLEISDKIQFSGNSKFIREFAIPFLDEIKPIAKEYPVQGSNPFESNEEPKLQAHLSEIAGIIGIMAFVASWTATKLLDEVYDIKISPLVKDKLRKYLGKSNTEPKYALTITTLNREMNVSLVIACIGSTVEEIQKSEKHIKSIFNYVQSNGFNANAGDVLLVVLDGDNLNLNIQTYSSYGEAIEILKSMYPAKLPKYRVEDE